MNSISYRRLSLVIGLATVTMLANGLSARSQTIAPSSSTPAPTPGTTATTAAALASQLAESASVTSTSRVAQTDINPESSPATPDPTAPDPTTPAPTTPDPTAPYPTTPAPTTPDLTTPDPTTPAPTTPDLTTPDPTTPTSAVSFTDVDPSYWAYPFIQALASRNAIAGFPDGTFRPDQPVTRTEFAAMLQRAVNPNPVRQLSPTGFADVPADFWGASAIRAAYESGFLNGYPNNLFLPNQEILKVQAITALANGLGLTASSPAANIVSTYYTDATQIPSYAIEQVAAATQANLVVNYPDVRTLNPQIPLTRAEAAGHLYQALLRLGQVQPLPVNVAAASYIVGGPGTVSQVPPTTPEETAPPEETTPTEETAPTPDIEPGRATRGGSSYIGVGANFGLSGDSALGDEVSLAVFSKIGLLNYVSVRPSVLIADDPTILIPITYDFNFQPTVAGGRTISLAPYVGAGVGIKTGEDSSVGFLLSGGLDVPISRQFTATASANALFGDDTDVGIWVGVGYNFTGF